MSRLIDADKIDFNEVFVGASEFAQDTRNAAQMLIDNQSTAFDLDKVVKQLKDLKAMYWVSIANTRDEKLDVAYEKVGNALDKAIEIVKGGGVE